MLAHLDLDSESPDDLARITAVHRDALEALTQDGPVLIEAMTYRYKGHSMSDPAKYRTREEVQKMREERDPIEQVRKRLLEGDASEDELKAIDKEIKDIINAAAEFAKESPEPDVAELYTDIYAAEVPQGIAAE